MLVVGPARASEVQRLLGIAATSLNDDVDAEWLSEAALCESCMVARDARSDEVLGFAVARREDACEGHLLALAVDRLHQNEGVGSALLKGVQDAMMRSGAMRLRLEVRADNTRAQSFYVRHGFSPLGLQEHAYRDGQDAVALERPL